MSESHFNQFYLTFDWNVDFAHRWLAEGRAVTPCVARKAQNQVAQWMKGFWRLQTLQWLKWLMVPFRWVSQSTAPIKQVKVQLEDMNTLRMHMENVTFTGNLVGSKAASRHLSAGPTSSSVFCGLLQHTKDMGLAELVSKLCIAQVCPLWWASIPSRVSLAF